ncbi:MAG: T9SS type A sorting domain-containing protein [Bacteroidota bacterium]
MTRVWAMSVFFLLSSLSLGQTRIKVSHLLREAIAPLQVRLAQSTPIDTIRILAIMVQFQTDNNEQTTGDGTFQITGSPAQIDPPPHDSTYFRNKIRFVENYFHKVSNRFLTITGSVVSQRIMLPKQMAEYSPPTTGTDNRKLAELAVESWHIADSLHPEIDFSKYDVFVIFHAGAGRDIDLVSSLGYNPTPYDIPSLYLDSTAFGAALEQSSFPGIVSGDIKNTIILPETESRVISGEILQLSSNGLFAASLGSYLGLPDLFDTKTGRSGIGQFGLMDGASIFAYNGLFPPEPSAWEKIYLGWIAPIPVRSSTAHLLLPAVGLSDVGEDTVYQIPISSSEYFLVENRNRNPHGTGLSLTFATARGDSIVHCNQDTVGFRYYDVSGISGSVVDVSNFDWAVIGDMTDGTGKYDGGGILIWHIDENIIQAGLKSNTVNADIEHRGVELMEADGSKDIGQSYGSLDAGSGTENGSPLDCWFSGNSAILYKNIFDRNSFPNNNSHSGAASLITIRNFSARSPNMTVTIEIGSSVLKRDTALSRPLAHATTYPTSTKNHHLYLPLNDSIFAFQSNGRSLTNDASGLFSGKKSSFGVAVYQQAGIEIVASVQDSALNIYQLTSPNAQGVFDSLHIFTRTIPERFTTSPCFSSLSILSTILIGTDSGRVYEFTINGDLISQRFVRSGPITSLALLPTPSLSKPEEYFCISGNRMYSERDSAELPDSQNKWTLAAAVSPKGNYVVAAEINGNRIVSFDQSLSQKLFEVSVPGSALQELAIADIDGDGEKDVIVQSATHISVLSRAGVDLDGFPIQARGANEFTGTPLIIDFDGDSKLEIITFTNDGEMWVYNRNGKLLTGFPIQVTSPGKSFPTAYTDSASTGGVVVLSENGSLDAFLTSTTFTANSLAWWQHLGDERHSNAEWTQTTSHPLSPEFLPKSRVYNWPNPVYGRSTHIRYYTSEEANITVTILDLSGVKITELKGRGTAGMDSEISWDVSNIQSGVYLARIEAHGVTQNEVTIIKIAIVK